MTRVPNRGKFLYGGDYNPEQWLDRPDILAEDVRLMKEAHVNTVTMGVFSWAALEKADGEYDFGWLKERIDTLYQNGISTILATPSGSRPVWLAEKYPSVLRVDENGNRAHYGFRHNHCMTSPEYRKKTYDIDRKLSEAFGRHPGVLAWHISNELAGACFCPLCVAAFRDFLREKYQTIDNVNRAWNTTFWSHTYSSFEEIEPPSPRGELFLHGLNLDWKRFVTERHRSFTANEIRAIRDGGSELPVTTNFMYNFTGLDYTPFAEDLDFTCWDNYPTWHKDPETETAADTAFEHDRIRSLKRENYLMMESCPTSTNWQSVSKLKRPGILLAQELQAIAHGADGALYFQIRQSRGASEKFHGALIDHYGGDDTRVFREAVRTGKALETLAPVLGSETTAEAAVVYDTVSRWAMEDAQGPRNAGLHYRETVQKSYNAFREYGINVDLVDETQSLDSYRVVAVPMAYLFRKGFEEKLRSYAANGGTLILTYWSGIADDTDLCFLGGTPHDFIDVCGFRSEEIDGLYDGEKNSASLCRQGNSQEEADGSGFAHGIRKGMKETYSCANLCELWELRGAAPLYTYDSDFYKGKAAVTSHPFGKGMVYGIAADFEDSFYQDFYREILEDLGVRPILAEVPSGVEVTKRDGDDGTVYIFLINWNREETEVPLAEGQELLYRSGEETGGKAVSAIRLAPFEVSVFRAE